jgi:hypothetical protein
MPISDPRSGRATPEPQAKGKRASHPEAVATLRAFAAGLL